MKKLQVVVVSALALVQLVETNLSAFAQPVTQNAVSGNECWNVGQGPGGPSYGYLCINQIRNGAGLALVSGSGVNVATTATQNNSTLFWTGGAPSTSWTVTMPSPAFDGEILTLATDTTLTTKVTVTAGSGQTLNNSFTLGTIAGGSSIEWQYSAGTAKWYQLR